MGAVTGEVVGLGDAKTLGLVVRFWPHRDTSVQSGIGRDRGIADVDQRALVYRNTMLP